MIPRGARLNLCHTCNTEGPKLPTSQQALELHRGLHDLFFVACEELRIDRLAEWLARRITR